MQYGLGARRGAGRGRQRSALSDAIWFGSDLEALAARPRRGESAAQRQAGAGEAGGGGVAGSSRGPSEHPGRDRALHARAMVVPTGRLPHWTAVGKGIEDVHGLTVVKQVSRWSRRRVNARQLIPARTAVLRRQRTGGLRARALVAPTAARALRDFTP